MTPASEMVHVTLFFFIAFALWETIVAVPLKLLVTYFHELGHCLAALVTGGKVDRFVVRMDFSGVAWTDGGNRFLVYNAGYLGGTFFGLLFFYLCYTFIGSKVLSLMGFIVLAGALLWLRPVKKKMHELMPNLKPAPFFVQVFAITAIATALVIFGLMIPIRWNIPVAKFLSVCIAMFAFIDQKSHFFHSSEITPLSSDSELLQDLTHIPKSFWQVAWEVVSICVFYGMFQISMSKG